MRFKYSECYARKLDFSISDRQLVEALREGISWRLRPFIRSITGCFIYNCFRYLSSAEDADVFVHLWEMRKGIVVETSRHIDLKQALLAL